MIEQLLVHGVKPTPATPPELVHELLNDLYRYELRRLRGRLLRREVAKTDYFDLVVAVRRRYPLLSQRVSQWMEI